MTDTELLKVALHGGEDEWQELYQTCRDRARAEQLARVQELHATDATDAAAAWANVLADLHPGLVVKLPHQRDVRNMDA
ncbi:MAG: hypothetical protein Q7S40_06980 [Opitutaceae bacterium]|nr:hypothetical protein [Opitutaceae bacterium]